MQVVEIHLSSIVDDRVVQMHPAMVYRPVDLYLALCDCGAAEVRQLEQLDVAGC